MSATGTLLTLARTPPLPVSPSRDASDHTTHASPIRRISSQRLLAGERELVIQHMGSEYHLRLTRNGKLILTK
ncbi:hemin uptake protein HemP [Dyella monticola]|uniref:Hemin uptake protein HemP n=1 Tax=Dyella monticola TaxID=1927958 RepID=A0A370X3Q7_9GAMM|nr:hemin uptake protein HemP [Dyella monticola]RDS83018.1 hemin uptake protein HemP [Dyella monticola]